MTFFLVASWCIGEFGDLLLSLPSSEDYATPAPDQVLDLFEKASRTTTDDDTREFILNSYFKLTVRSTEEVELI